MNYFHSNSPVIAKQLTTASRCPPTPLSVGHAGYCVPSLHGVPWVTPVGHCGPKGSTGASFLSICRGTGDTTTADSWREDTITTFFVARMQAHAMQYKQKGTESSHTSSLYMCNQAITKLLLESKSNTKTHAQYCMYRSYTCKGMSKKQKRQNKR